jgi:hypothetical protein
MRLSQLISFLAIPFFLAGCQTSDNSVKSESHELKESEISYKNLIRDKTKKATIYVNFESRVKVGVLRLDDSMFTSLKQRALQNYSVDKITPLIGPKAKDEEVFLLSVFSKNWDDDLKGSPNWHIELGQMGQKFAPSEIKRLNQKDFLASFFDSVDHWSTEYVLRFGGSAAPEVNLAESQPITLKIAHTDGVVLVGW